MKPLIVARPYRHIFARYYCDRGDDYDGIVLALHFPWLRNYPDARWLIGRTWFVACVGWPRIKFWFRLFDFGLGISKYGISWLGRCPDKAILTFKK